MSFEYVEVYAVADHHRNTAPDGGTGYFAVCRHRFAGLSGAPDIAGAVDVGESEEPRGPCIMRIESESTGEPVFSVTPAAKRNVG